MITTVSALLFAGALAASSAVYGAIVQKRAAAFENPASGGGSMFVDTLNGLGEPLNVIISGLSSPAVLNEDGLINYARAVGFSTECFGIHLGDPFPANLGDGHGPVNQTTELRQDFGDSEGGTCLESLIGGNHFRVYFQNGPSANTGAAFLAVSKEKPVTDHHDIVDDGYNIGRDALVSAAVGTHAFEGVTYVTSAQNITGLMAAGSNGVNHGIAVDGNVTLLTVTIQ
ncbi:hypothetical protein C8T65DRAFT_578966 [Cerioporus squamosus]|nr:hypothetical protein C8T65DRAFT_578966 [Cerioporus squamosus]